MMNDDNRVKQSLPGCEWYKQESNFIGTWRCIYTGRLSATYHHICFILWLMDPLMEVAYDNGQNKWGKVWNSHVDGQKYKKWRK